MDLLMIRTFLLLAAVPLFAADPLPITGLSHVAFKVSDLDRARPFYGDLLGLIEDGPIYHINANQFVKLIKVTPVPEDRLDHIGIGVSNLDAMQRGLAARGIRTSPGEGRSLRVTDPDGNAIEFVLEHTDSRYATVRGEPLSRRLLHTGAKVHDPERALAFYRDQLGLTEFWRGGPTDSETRWINLRLPGPRGDYLELMLYSQPPDVRQLGSMHHICLEVPDIQAAHKLAVSRGAPASAQPKVGRNRKWQLNLFDPDGTRTELMEPNIRSER